MRTCIPAIARESWSRALRAALSPPLAACRSSRARVSTFAGRAAPGSAGQGQSSRHLSHCAGSCDARGTGPGGRLRSCRRARPARLAAICPAPLLGAGKCASSRHGRGAEKKKSWVSQGGGQAAEGEGCRTYGRAFETRSGAPRSVQQCSRRAYWARHACLHCRSRVRAVTFWQAERSWPCAESVVRACILARTGAR